MAGKSVALAFVLGAAAVPGYAPFYIYPLPLITVAAIAILLLRTDSTFKAAKPTVLITYDMPPLKVKAPFSQFFPIIGPLGASISGSIGAEVDFAFGFDSVGIKQFADTDFRNPALIFNGFFISDTDVPASSTDPIILAE